MKVVSGFSSSRVASGYTVTDVQQVQVPSEGTPGASPCLRDLWKITAQEVENASNIVTIYSEIAVLATGGQQLLPSLQVPNHNKKMLSSDFVITKEGIAELESRLSKIKQSARKVVIIGGSHSAFSAAWICLNKLDPQLVSFGPGNISIVHRTPVMVFYGTRREADVDGYGDFKQVCKHGQVHPFGGIRGDAKQLYRQIKSGKETRVRMLLIKGGSSAPAAMRLMDEAAIIVWACGYSTCAVPVRGIDGTDIPLQFSCGQVEVDDNARVLRSSDPGAFLDPSKSSADSAAAEASAVRQAASSPIMRMGYRAKPVTVPNLYATGLGYGLKATYDNGEPDGSSGRADGVAVFLKRSATLILSSVLGNKVFGDNATSWKERIANGLAQAAAAQRNRSNPPPSSPNSREMSSPSRPLTSPISSPVSRISASAVQAPAAAVAASGTDTRSKSTAHGPVRSSFEMRPTPPGLKSASSSRSTSRPRAFARPEENGTSSQAPQRAVIKSPVVRSSSAARPNQRAPNALQAPAKSPRQAPSPLMSRLPVELDSSSFETEFRAQFSANESAKVESESPQNKPVSLGLSAVLPTADDRANVEQSGAIVEHATTALPTLNVPTLFNPPSLSARGGSDNSNATKKITPPFGVRAMMSSAQVNPYFVSSTVSKKVVKNFQSPNPTGNGAIPVLKLDRSAYNKRTQIKPAASENSKAAEHARISLNRVDLAPFPPSSARQAVSAGAVLPKRAEVSPSNNKLESELNHSGSKVDRVLSTGDSSLNKSVSKSSMSVLLTPQGIINTAHVPTANAELVDTSSRSNSHLRIVGSGHSNIILSPIRPAYTEKPPVVSSPSSPLGSSPGSMSSRGRLAGGAVLLSASLPGATVANFPQQSDLHRSLTLNRTTIIRS
jgi:hypothetical protein